MLDVSAEHLWAEVRKADLVNDRFLGGEYEDQLARFAGKYFSEGVSEGDEDLENGAAQWITVYAPLLLSGTPRVKTKSSRLGEAQDISKALQFALNRNIVDTKFHRTAELWFMDWAFRWCVSLTCQESDPGCGDIDDPIHRPVSTRLPLDQYVSDPLALYEDEERWRGHKVIRDKQSLLVEAREHPERGWNKKLIEGLTEDANLEKAGRRDEEGADLLRGEVVYVEIWVPEHRLDRAVDEDGEEFVPSRELGFHGTIFTIAYEQLEYADNGKMSELGEYLREPRPFYGPPEGPYTYGGAWTVPDEPKRLSPIALFSRQNEELNALRSAIAHRIQKHKRGVAIRGEDASATAQAVETFLDQGVLSLPNISPDERVSDVVMPIEVGGADQTDIGMFEFLRSAFERGSGISDALLGESSAGTTATAEAIASSSAGRRSGYLALKFLRFEEEVLRKEAWYFLNDNRSVKVLGPEAVGEFFDESGEMIQQPVFLPPERADMDSMEIEIDIYSVSRTSEAQEAATSEWLLNLGLTVAPAIPQSVLFFDWERWLQEAGERRGIPDLAGWMDLDAARQIATMTIGAQVGGQGFPASPPQPRLSADIKSPTDRSINGFANIGSLGSKGYPTTKKEVAGGLQ